MAPASAPRLSVIVPAGDGPPTLPRCVEAIEAAVGPGDEVIVVERPGLGPAEARNEGAGQASREVLVFVDSDVVVHGDALGRLREAFAGDPALVATFGAYDDEPEARDPVSGFRNLLHHCMHRRGAGAASTFWTGLGAVRREAFAAAGGFDAAGFPRAVEDIELGARLARSGARIVLDPDVQGKHLKAWTLSTMVTTDFARRGVPWAELVLEGAADPNALNLGWRNRLSALAAIVTGAGTVRRRVGIAAAGVAALVALNADLYGLILRRRGLAQAALAVPLHVVHLGTAILAVPAALVLRLARGRSRAGAQARPETPG